MTTNQNKIQQIFAEAIEIESPDERLAFLDQACGGDEQLQAAVQKLLDSYRDAGSFMDRPIAQVDEQEIPQPAASSDAETQSNDILEGPSSVIGPYKLLQLIGEGGMGSVYMAEQEKPVKRRVALKVIKAGMDTKQVIARFEAERQALAMMDHPSIARLLDVGTTDSGRPYFVMELVKGVPITDYCDQKQLNITQRLELFSLVCHAVQHAHQKGIIHRDIKPSNILITQYDEKVVPKIIDFGLVKALGQTLTDLTMFTQFGQVMGTLAYMSPEQSKVNALDIDTRADIYSLGVLLYELLTGTTPFDKSTLKDNALDQILKTIREEVPPKPSTRLSSDGTDPQIAPNRNTDPTRLGRLVRGDLDWIVMKALEKERSRRYESASGFADDIERYLGDEPVVARPPSTGYRIQKFVRKNRGLVASVSAMLLLLIAGLAGTSWFAYQANQLAKDEKAQREIADEKTREAEASAKRSKDVLKIVTDSFRSTDPDEGGTGDMTAKDVLFNAQKALDSSELDEEGKASLLWVLGFAFTGLGEADSAVSACEKVLSLRKEMLGANHPDTLRAMTALAACYGDAGRLKKAQQLLEKVIPLKTEKLGANHPATLRAMVNQANGYFQSGRLEEGLLLHEKVLPLLTEKLGPDHPDTLSAMANLAISYRKAGRMTEALPLYEKVLALRTEKLAGDHSDTLSAMINLANGYVQSGRYQEALLISEMVLPLSTEKLGADHPQTLMSMANLAICYSNTGRMKEALQLREKLLPLMTEKLGPNHPATLGAMNNLAVAYGGAGRMEEAQQLLEKVLSLLTEKLGPNHPDTLSAMTNLAACYPRAGKLVEALQLREKILPLKIEKLGEDHPDTLRAMANLANSYFQSGRFEEALQLRKKILLIRTENLGPDHPDTLVSMTELAGSYSQAGRLEEALKLRENVLPLMNKKLGEDHPDTLRAITYLAQSYGREGRTEEALQLVEKVLPLSVEKLGPDHPDTLLAMASLVASYAHVGREEEALDLAQRLVELAPNNLRHQITLGGSLSNLARKEIKAENFDVARDLLKRAVAIQQRVLKVDPGNKLSRKFLAIHYRLLLDVGQGLDDSELISEAEKGLAELESHSKGQ